MMAVLSLLGIVIDLAQCLAMHNLGAEPLQGTVHPRVDDPTDPHGLRGDRLCFLFLSLGAHRREFMHADISL